MARRPWTIAVVGAATITVALTLSPGVQADPIDIPEPPPAPAPILPDPTNIDAQIQNNIPQVNVPSVACAPPILVDNCFNP
ncbi:MAG: hypothetical protein AB7G47_14065 [Mycolicibacterium sp.]|uniref:hypothetical protein n=1 Tax=Mycolicibacterium sp. TaxID=2320850 RepID=UPI003D0A470E